VDGFGPGDWFSVKKGVEAGASAMSGEQLLAAIRLGGFDAKLFMDTSDRLFALAGNAAPAERRACFTLARRMWELHYELGEHRDLAFHLGSWMRELGYLEEAIRYFEISRRTRGPQAITAYNLAFCPPRPATRPRGARPGRRSHQGGPADGGSQGPAHADSSGAEG
jgi:hypothetical protein